MKSTYVNCCKMELFLKSSWTPGKRCIFKNTVLSLASWKIWIILFFNLILLPRLQLYIYKKTKSSIYRVSEKKANKANICFIFYISFKSTGTCVFGIFQNVVSQLCTFKIVLELRIQNSDLNNPNGRKNTFILYCHQCLQ